MVVLNVNKYTLFNILYDKMGRAPIALSVFTDLGGLSQGKASVTVYFASWTYYVEHHLYFKEHWQINCGSSDVEISYFHKNDWSDSYMLR